MRPQRLAQKSEDQTPEKARAELRRFRRFAVNMSGRLFLPSDNCETICKITDMSPGGASLECELIPDMSTPIILYIDGLGRFEGAVARLDANGFGVRFSSTQLKRERTAEQLALLVNMSLLDESDLRRDERTPLKAFTRFTRHDGTLTDCEVLDLSTSGVSLKTTTKPAVGEFILIGQMAGRVARHLADGIGIEFVGLGSDRPSTDVIHARILIA